MRRLGLLLVVAAMTTACGTGSDGGGDAHTDARADTRADARTDATGDTVGSDVVTSDAADVVSADRVTTDGSDVVRTDVVTTDVVGTDTVTTDVVGTDVVGTDATDVQTTDVVMTTDAQDVQSADVVDVQTVDVVDVQTADVQDVQSVDAIDVQDVQTAADVQDVQVVDVPVVDVPVVDVPIADSGSVEVCNGIDDDGNGVTDDAVGCNTHLLITEMVNGPTFGEFIEIYNPTPNVVNLRNYYLSDNDQYWSVAVTGMVPTGGTPVATSDFVVRFPDGSQIQPGEYITVATQSNVTSGSSQGDFATLYGVCPTYFIATSAPPTCTTTRQMQIVPGGGGTAATLTNGQELAILFTWDGTSDLVQDVDYVYYGTPTASNPPVDKTGKSIDGPDSDSTPSMYLPDTNSTLQSFARASTNDGSMPRCDFTEGTERKVGGNGITGHDETSEDLATTFSVLAPAMPNMAPPNASPNAANNCP